MPKSKAAPRRAKKLEQRREKSAQRLQNVSYTFLLDTLREALNNRFYEEQGFPHLEILAANYNGPVRHGNLADYVELQDMFIGFSYALAATIRRNAPYSMEEREDRVAGVAYTIAATLLNIRPDYKDDSGWMGAGVIDAIRERWGRAKMSQAGIDITNRYMDPRILCSLFAMDFVMTFLDLTGELAQMGGDKVISVTECKDAIVTIYTGFTTSNLALAGDRLPDLEELFAENAVTDDFRKTYPDWKPEDADALNVERMGFNSVSEEDMAFMASLLSNSNFMHDMRVLYTAAGSADVPQGKREEIVMGYALRDGPRCRKAFAEGRDPTEEEMDRDAEVINGIVMQMVRSGGIDFGVQNEEASVGAYKFASSEAEETAFAPSTAASTDADTIASLVREAREANEKRSRGELAAADAGQAAVEALVKAAVKRETEKSAEKKDDGE